MLASRWLQAPMYLALIGVQGVFAIRFLMQFLHLIQAWMGDPQALAHVVEDVGYHRSVPVTHLGGILWALAVLELIETLMVANLLQIMIVGGYKTYINRISTSDGRSSPPEWVAHASATNLKLKLALSIIGVSSFNMLETFINADQYADRVLWAQAGLHGMFLLSALVVALIDWLQYRMHANH